MSFKRETQKTYWAIIKNKPAKPNDKLIHFIKNEEKQYVKGTY
jgi:23S rRNA pseudouridine1911/1915/1917 synthase